MPPLKTSLSGVLLLLSTSLMTAPGHALQPTYGSGISVDGDFSDWNLVDDYFAPLYLGGNPDNSPLATLYLRYDCTTKQLQALVLDQEGDAHLPLAQGLESWIKVYDQGWAADLLIDGTGDGNTLPRSFQWVLDGQQQVIGYEASAQLIDGVYTAFEAALSYGGQFASTGGSVFDAEALDIELEALAGPDARVRVVNPYEGGPAYFPTTEIDFDGDGTVDYTTTSWCIDTDHNINQNTWNLS
jgi:hypothetical protein